MARTCSGQPGLPSCLSSQGRTRSSSSGVGAGSGGHLAGLLGTTAGLSEFEGDANPGYSSAVQAVAAFHPAMDLAALYDANGEEAYVIECVRLLLGVGGLLVVGVVVLAGLTVLLRRQSGAG